MNELAPVVSIILPVYNGERYLRQAILSTVNQSWHDWELIIVDDGSTDNTSSIISAFSDPRITAVRQENGGEAAARNRGLDAVNGKYVAFLDADDLYLPHALREMSAYLDSHPDVDAVFTDGYFCDESDRILRRLSEVRSAVSTGIILEPLVLDSATIGTLIFTMIRSETIRKAGVRFDPGLVIGPDWDFLIHLAIHATFGYLDVATCMYRVHKANITLTSTAARRRADLVRGRLKVMNASWFEELSIQTRRSFFYNLLIGLLGDQPEQQRAIMAESMFLALPRRTRAELLRLVASDKLAKQHDVLFARDCLRFSLDLEPDNLKARALLALARRNPALTAVVVNTWQKAIHARTELRLLGRHKPAPVPLAPPST